MSTTATPRAIKLTSETLKVIGPGSGINFDLPPSLDDLIDLVTTPNETYYFVTDCPGLGFTATHPLSWVVMPDFMLHEHFKFAAKESNKQLVSIISKEN